jgi:hypothetical protein
VLRRYCLLKHVIKGKIELKQGWEDVEEEVYYSASNSAVKYHSAV